MKMDRDFHMAKGGGETSYANNSRLQEKAMLELKPVLGKIIREVYMALLPPTMVVADLGCSSGPNTLLFISEVISVIRDYSKRIAHPPVELQFFLNDLPCNDFNHLFESLEQLQELVVVANNNAESVLLPPHYIVGLPGSYYTRLFPHHSVHFFHSSYCLMWRSQMFEVTESKRIACLNEGNIYIAKTTPPTVVKLYQEQFEKDLSLFLRLRSEELVAGGKMLLTFLGRKTDDVYSGELSCLYGLLGQALQSLVVEGLVEKKKLDSFNVPIYGPSVDEVKTVTEKSKMFDVSHLRLFESNWDPYDDSEGDDALADGIQSGVNVAKCIRAVMEPLMVSHFGEFIIDKLFASFACNVARHLQREKTKFSVIVLSLNARNKD